MAGACKRHGLEIFRRGVLVACSWLLVPACLCGDEPLGEGERRQLRESAREILQRHCVECHGPDRQGGGLRLDQLQSAQQGGFSRKTILGGELEANELWRRVSSVDPVLRMPKAKPPLSDWDREQLRQWVLHGSPWWGERQVPAESPVPPVPPSLIARWTGFERDDDFFDYCIEWGEFLRGYTPWVLLMALFIGFTERYQYRARQQQQSGSAGQPTATPAPAPIPAPAPADSRRDGGPGAPRGRFRWLLRVRKAHYLVLVLGSLLVIVIDLYRAEKQAHASRLGKLTARVRHLERDLGEHSSGAVVSRFGMPPRPDRPPHPKRVSGTYWRGNCERSPQLFNGGNYCTAIFRIALCDQQGKRIEIGDPLPPDGLFLQLEMERAPKTHDSFYTKETVAGVGLTRQVFGAQLSPVVDPLVRLTVEKDDWLWSCRYPLGKPAPDQPQSLSGMVYLYQGNGPGTDGETKAFQGVVHYGISYDLLFAEGRLREGSDLWMGSLLWIPPLFKTPAGKIPVDEWFDYRPLPEITGENSNDPRLLGIKPAAPDGTVAPPPGPKDQPAPGKTTP